MGLVSAAQQFVVGGNNLEILARMPDASVHAVVTDPPYGLGFMLSKKHGKNLWDAALPDPRTWSECLRVLRPGGHLVAFGAPRLVHRLTCQIEDAGFEIRDQLLWVFGSGFPKSLDVSKAIDKDAGVWRGRAGAVTTPEQLSKGTEYERTDKGEPSTPDAARWSGWGTALKPAYEPIVLARKPLDGTVAQTVQRWGTGAINVDGCRVEAPDGVPSFVQKGQTGETYGAGLHGSARTGEQSTAGRWPANLILDEAAGALLDQQSGTRRSAGDYPSDAERGSDNATNFGGRPGKPYADSGGASRFFYCPKASRSEREAGLEDLPPRTVDPSRAEGTPGRESPRAGAGRSGEGRRNHHATVKPVELMRWLVRLVCPPGGIVLEPFAGSGTTLVACAIEGVDAVGMEIDAEYVAIARARIAHARTA